MIIIFLLDEVKYLIAQLLHCFEETLIIEIKNGCQLPSALPHVTIPSLAAALTTDIPITLLQSWHSATMKETILFFFQKHPETSNILFSLFPLVAIVGTEIFNHNLSIGVYRRNQNSPFRKRNNFKWSCKKKKKKHCADNRNPLYNLPSGATGSIQHTGRRSREVTLFYGSWTREFINDFIQEKPAQDENQSCFPVDLPTYVTVDP